MPLPLRNGSYMMLSQPLRQSPRLNYKNIVRNFFRCNLLDQTTYRTSPQTTKRTQNNKEMWHITVTVAIAMCREISDYTTFHILRAICITPVFTISNAFVAVAIRAPNSLLNHII